MPELERSAPMPFDGRPCFTSPPPPPFGCRRIWSEKSSLRQVDAGRLFPDARARVGRHVGREQWPARVRGAGPSSASSGLARSRPLLRLSRMWVRYSDERSASSHGRRCAPAPEPPRRSSRETRARSGCALSTSSYVRSRLFSSARRAVMSLTRSSEKSANVLTTSCERWKPYLALGAARRVSSSLSMTGESLL